MYYLHNILTISNFVTEAPIILYFIQNIMISCSKKFTIIITALVAMNNNNVLARVPGSISANLRFLGF